MKRTLFFLGVLFVSLSAVAQEYTTRYQSATEPQTLLPTGYIRLSRYEIILPSVGGYNPYKADLHIHSALTDGVVNIKGRVEEAWCDGLDVIAATEHMSIRPVADTEGKPTPESVRLKKSSAAVKAVTSATKVAETFGVVVIPGVELTGDAKTQGHFNALFLEDINGLYDPDLEVALRKVKEQGGIVIHNHPAWRRKTSDKTEFHERVYSQGLVDGVEVVNGYTFYPHIVRRCIDENLTMFANRDEHSFTSNRFGAMGNHRTMTLIFAKELTEKSIKDAILKRRTIAYSGGSLIGEESWLVELLNESVDCRLIRVDNKSNEHTYMLTNQSSITYRLRRGKTIYELEPFKPIMVSFGKDKEGVEAAKPVFTADNLWIADYKHPKVTIEVDKK